MSEAGSLTLTEVDVVVRPQMGSWLVEELEDEPDQPVVWLSSWSGRSAVEVRNVEHLAVLISGLARAGAFGGVEWVRGDVRRWGQTMRVHGGWIIEAHDGSEHDYAQRIHRGEPGDYPAAHRSKPHHLEVWTSLGAAEVLWSWLAGSLPEGCCRTIRR